MKRVFFPPHFRLVAAFICGLLISAVHSLPLLSALLFIAAAGLTAVLIRRRESLLFYLRRWAAFNLFTLCIWLTLSWKIGEHGLERNSEGIRLAWLITLRMNLILCSIRLLLLDMGDSILVQAVSRLPLPDKFIHLFILTVRYIALLAGLNRQMGIAMKARGFRPQPNARTFAVTAQRVALLLIQVMVRVETSEMALKARGFRFESKSSLLDKPWWKTCEILTALLLILWIYYAQG